MLENKKMLLVSINFCLAFILLFSNSIRADDRVSILSGKVIESAKSTPLKGVKVFARLPNSQKSIGMSETNDMGNYTISGLEPGNYIIYASKYGFVTSTKSNVSVANGKITNNIIFYLRQGKIVRGTIVEKNTLNPIIGAIVEVKSIQNIKINSIKAQTDHLGKYEVTIDFPAFYDSNMNEVVLVVYSEGFERAVKLIEVSGYISDANFTLSQGGNVYGKITKTDGTTPIVGATVFIQHQDYGTIIDTILTDTDGNYNLVNISEGPYWLLATSKDFADKKSEPFTITNGISLEKNMELSLPGHIEGKITREDNVTPISKAVVIAKFTDFDEGSMDISNDDGYYKIWKIVGGEYTVQVIREGFVPLTQEGVLVTPGESLTLNLSLIEE